MINTAVSLQYTELFKLFGMKFPRFVLQMGGRCSLSSETAVDNKWILIVKPPEQ